METYYSRNKEKINARQKEYRAENKERILKKRQGVAASKKMYDEQYRAANKERVVAAKKKYVLENPEADKARKDRYRQAHAIKLRAENIAYNHLNATARAEYLRKYQQENAGKVRHWAMKRLTGKLQRTPAWLDEDDMWMIEQAYELAALRTKLFGFKWHVDHVIPLQGRLVSGLHVPTNLQVIPALHNLAKGNCFAVEV